MSAVRVLGRVEVDDPGADHALGRGQSRELLAYLVARRGQPASTELIIDALWPEASPATAPTIVHGLVRRIRSALGAAAVVRSEDGYRLDLPTDAVDLWSLDARLAAGDTNAARAAWRDPAFGSYATRGWAQEAMAGAQRILRPDPEHTSLLRTRRRVPVSRLVGRRRELAAVANACQRSRLVSIVGLGGVGKTRLALEAVRQLDHDDVIHVDVGAAVGPAASRVVAEMGQASSGDAQTDLRATASLIGRTRRLLLLDGCEHDAAGSAGVVELLLGLCPDLSVIATSRSALGVPGEHVVPLLPFADPVDPRGDAVELLLDRAQGMGLAVSGADRDRAAAICARSAGVPLAIELGVAELVFGVEPPAPAVLDADPTTPEDAVTQVVSQALTQLSEPTAVAARRAAQLVAGFTPELAAALRPERHATGTPTGILHELVASGLVASETAGASRRLRFLDRVREALVAQMDDDDRAAVLTAVAGTFTAVRADLAQPLSIPHLARAVGELANAEALLEDLARGECHDDRLALAAAVADTWAEDGQWAHGADRMGDAIANAEPGTDPHLWAQAVRALGAVTATYDGARRLAPTLERAAAIAQDAGDRPLEGHLRLHLANAYGYEGRLQEGFAQLERMEVLATETGADYLRLGVEGLTAMGRMLTGDPIGASEELRGVAAAMEALGGLGDAARLHRSASIAARGSGQPEAALRDLARAERLAQEAHARGTLATVRTDIADLRFQQGEINDEALNTALEAVLAVGNLRAAGIIRTRLGQLHRLPSTIALGTLDLLHADRRWAAASLATLLSVVGPGHPLQRLGPGAITGLLEQWGTPLDAREAALVEPYSRSSSSTGTARAAATDPAEDPCAAAWEAELVGHLEAVVGSLIAV